MLLLVLVCSQVAGPMMQGSSETNSDLQGAAGLHSSHAHMRVS
jgi:hypothetical protein